MDREIKYRTDYETVSSQQSDQILGVNGGSGNVLEKLIIVPLSVNAGGVSIKDGSGSSISLFQGGTSSLSNLQPFVVDVGASCVTNWSVTTGSAVTAVAVGRFS